MVECVWCAGIAIVEDEKDLVNVYERILQKRGIPICFIAYDGNEAILKFIASTPKPHIVVMDYRLPTLNGIEATKKILEIDPETKIIFLSADVSVREEALQIGVFIFIAKPASLKEITDAIENIIKTCPNLKV